MISVICQSYLGTYKGCATDRETKLKVAIESVIKQTYQNWELIIVADGCDKTVEITTPYLTDSRIKLFKIDKQPIWSGVPRNVGIEKATGEYICYLDSDDYFGKGYLQFIADNIKSDKWVFFHDIIFRSGKYVPRQCTAYRGKCGTSNIAHRKDLNILWNTNNIYGSDDWQFIRKLLVFPYRIIGLGEYYVCHVPGKVGYDC